MIAAHAPLAVRVAPDLSPAGSRGCWIFGIAPGLPARARRQLDADREHQHRSGEGRRRADDFAVRIGHRRDLEDRRHHQLERRQVGQREVAVRHPAAREHERAVQIRLVFDPDLRVEEAREARQREQDDERGGECRPGSGVHGRVWYFGWMPLVSLDRVSIAFGHLPLLDEASCCRSSRASACRSSGATAPASPRSCAILSGELRAGRGQRLACARGCASRASSRTCRSPTGRSVFDVVADGLPTRRRTRTDAWRREHQVDLVLSRLDLPADAIVDTLSGGWRRRVLLARALVVAARPAAARRADQPSRHRRHHVARDVSRRLRGRRRVRDPRPRVSPAARHAHRRARSRDADVVARRLRDVPAAEGGVAGQRGRAGRRSSTSGWRRRRRGCGRASRRGARANEGRVRALMAMRAERAGGASRWAASRLQGEIWNPYSDAKRS